jgi:PncC family amidohydrolase
LKGSDQTIAVAESATGGLLQAAIASAESAGDIFQGGITAYNLGQKARHLSVEPIHASSCDCVSASVARQMAVGAREMFSSDWAIAVTGYATPVPESGNKVFAYISICCKGDEVYNQKIKVDEAVGLPAQLLFVEKAIDGFLQVFDSTSG